MLIYVANVNYAIALNDYGIHVLLRFHVCVKMIDDVVFCNYATPTEPDDLDFCGTKSRPNTD